MKKRKIIVIISGIAILISLCIGLFLCLQLKTVDDYKQYIGKYYRDLPSEFSTEPLNDVFYKAELDKIVKFKGNKGKISFTYSIDDKMEMFGIPTNTLDKLEWKSNKCTNKQYEKIKLDLEELYGEYDDFTEYENKDLNKYGVGEGKTIVYNWYSKDGMNIKLNYQTDASDNVVDIYIFWEKA